MNERLDVSMAELIDRVTHRRITYLMKSQMKERMAG